MSLMNESSPVTSLPEYDIYALPAVQTTVESTIVTEHRPISVLNSGGHIEFLITTGINEYIIPKDTLLFVKLRVLLNKADKTEVKETDWNNVSIINNFLNSLWQQIDIAIGDTQTTVSLQTYSWKSYFENSLGYSDDSKKAFLSAGGWFTNELYDTPHSVNSLRSEYIKHKTPEGVEKDKDKEWNTGKYFELFGKLNFDLAFQPRALIGGCKIRIRLIPNQSEFFFICSDSNLIPKIEFNEIALNITRAKVNQEIVLAHHKALQVSPARYPITRTDVRTTTINSGTLNATLENVMNGQLPRRCFICFVSNEAYNGSYKKNPFYFNHYDINFLACYLNGDQFPRKAFQPDFENGLYLREYIEFFRAMNEMHTDTHITINRNDYLKGRTIFGFNFSPDLSNGSGIDGYISQGKLGTMRLEIHFKKALTETINVLIFSEFDNIILIPEDRNAIIDYH